MHTFMLSLPVILICWPQMRIFAFLTTIFHPINTGHMIQMTEAPHATPDPRAFHNSKT